MNEYELELNFKVTNYFKNLEKKLNKNTLVLKLQPGSFYNVPTIVSLGNSQIIPNNGDTYSLLTPEAGMIVDVPKGNKDKKRVLIRRLIGYSYAARFVNYSEEEIAANLNILTTEMLMTLEKQLGFKHNTANAGQYYALFHEAGKTNRFFREQEISAAYELILYSDTWSCIDLKENSK
jgi:hypothetical protein